MRAMTLPCITMLLVAVAGSGCLAHYKSFALPIDPQQRRVGVILTNDDGVAVPTLKRNYVYDALIKQGLVPVALHDADVGHLARASAHVLANAGAAPDASGRPQPLPITPATLSALKDHFATLGIAYVLVWYAHTSGLDEDLRAVVIRTADMAVIASEYYRYRVMYILLGALTPAFGASFWLVPWFYLRNAENANYERVNEFISHARGGAGAAPR